MTLQEPPARPGLSSKARELMEEINSDAAKDHIWVRTQMNAPAQRLVTVMNAVGRDIAVVINQGVEKQKFSGEATPAGV